MHLGHAMRQEAKGQFSKGCLQSPLDLSVLEAYVVKQAQDGLSGSIIFPPTQTKETSVMLTALREMFPVTEVQKLAKYTYSCCQDSLLRAPFLTLLVQAAMFIPQHKGTWWCRIHSAVPCRPWAHLSLLLISVEKVASLASGNSDRCSEQAHASGEARYQKSWWDIGKIVAVDVAPVLSSTLAKVGDSFGISWLCSYKKQTPMLPFDMSLRQCRCSSSRKLWDSILLKMIFLQCLCDFDLNIDEYKQNPVFSSSSVIPFTSAIERH